MYLNKIFYAFLVLLLCSSCSGLIHINNVNPIRGLYSRYDYTEARYPGLLIKTETNTICSLKYSESQVYIINGEQIKQCLSSFDDAIVYIWDANCTSKQCFSPSLLQKYCDQKNIELFVVAEYYDGEDLVQFYEINRPLFGIDTKHYKSDFIEKYVSRFEKDLTAEEDTVGRMLYFKKGKYMGKAELEFEN